VTISQGITSLREGDELEDLYARADAAMYQAKRQGKDCIVLG
jgi:PleD family two-component response regulator